MTFNCCVCFENFEKDGFKCDTCNLGKVCDNCYVNNWTFIEDDFERRYGYECDIGIREILEKVIKCPCCRNLNWKEVYSSIFTCLKECDREDMFKKNTSEKIKDYAYKFS
jgi:hypothetical protein